MGAWGAWGACAWGACARGPPPAGGANPPLLRLTVAMRQSATTPPPDAVISRIAARQHGVVSLAQLRALGLDHAAVRRRVRAGRVHRLHRGVYAVGHTVLTREGRWLAAVLASGPGAVLSHRSAAALWGLRPTTAARIDVTVPFTNSHRSRRLVTVHHARRPVPAVVRAAIPVTTPARTLADLAEVLHGRALEKAAELACAEGLLDVRAVDALVAEHPNRAGPTRLARMMRTHDLDTRTRSTLEDAFLALCDRHGIPRPAVNARIAGLEVDFTWPAARLVVETDGRRHHTGSSAFERDRDRDATLALAGWRVMRFTHRQVLEEAARVAEIVIRILVSPAGATSRRDAATATATRPPPGPIPARLVPPNRRRARPPQGPTPAGLVPPTTPDPTSAGPARPAPAAATLQPCRTARSCRRRPRAGSSRACGPARPLPRTTRRCGCCPTAAST